MQYEDRITIATPEGVDVELVLGGVGSRFSAAIIDVLVQGLLLLVAGLVLFLVVGGNLGAAVFALASFAILFVYDVAFEVWNGGRTPGKKANGLRVVVEDGRPVTFTRSAVRNIMRILDVYVVGGLVGAAMIVMSKRNQRLGDMAAGTLVVRELVAPSGATRMTPTVTPRVDLPPWDVSAISADELGAVRSFLQRRDELTQEARVQVRGMLADKLRPKIVGADAHIPDEQFLELLALVKAARI